MYRFIFLVVFLVMLNPIRSLGQSETKIFPNDGQIGDRFGGAVSINGNLAIIGAHTDDDKAKNAGAVYIFEWNVVEWEESAKLIANDGATDDSFGYSVSIDRNTAIVGAPTDVENGTESGSAYIFERTGATWTEVAKLTASNGNAGELFGWHVSISGNIAVIGAPAYEKQQNMGAVYIFERQESSWNETAMLLASDGENTDAFGISVSVDDKTIIVGANGDNGNSPDSGSAYIFELHNTKWHEVAKLNASNEHDVNRFGQSVSVSDDKVIVGATNSAYVFERKESGWQEIIKVPSTEIETKDRYGWSVSISEDKAVVGAFGDEDEGNFAGAIYVLGKKGESWNELFKMKPSDGHRLKQFGESISINEGRILVGAAGDSGAIEDDSQRGAAYVYDALSIDPNNAPIKDQDKESASLLILAQNYPNPFISNTTIAFYLSNPSVVHLGIYDLMGREVKVLLDRYLEKGEYSAAWTGMDKRNRRVANGIYFYRINIGSFSETGTMIRMGNTVK